MKYRVYSYQVVRVPYEVEAASAEMAASVVDENGWDGMVPCGPKEATEEWLPEMVVDPLLPNGEVDYDRVTTVDRRSALDLRIEAVNLLEKAKSLDGLMPFVVTHSHEYGSSSYVAWSDKALTMEDAAAILDVEFDPDKGESLEIEDSMTLEEVSGLSALQARENDRAYEGRREAAISFSFDGRLEGMTVEWKATTGDKLEFNAWLAVEYPNVTPVVHSSVWEEGSFATTGYLDLTSGEVAGVEHVEDEDDRLVSMIGTFVRLPMGDELAEVELLPDNTVRVSNPDDLARLRFEALSSRLPENVELASQGNFIGSVMEVSKGIVLQNSGRGVIVAHDLGKFEDDPKVGDLLNLKYANGAIKVSGRDAPGQQQSQGR